MSFNAAHFAQHPTSRGLVLLKKSHLLEVGTQIGLDVSINMTRPELINKLLNHFVDDELLDETALDHLQAEPVSAREVARLKLETDKVELEKARLAAEEKDREDRLALERTKLELEEKRLAVEERTKLEVEEKRLAAEERTKREEREAKLAAERELEERKLAAERESEERKLAAEREEREAKHAIELKIETARLAATERDRIVSIELEREKLAAEEREREARLAAEEREREARLAAETELKKLELEAQMTQLQYKAEHPESFRSELTSQGAGVLKKTHKLPVFDEEQVDQFFLQFEKLAHHMKWPTDEWVSIIQGHLVGRAQEIYTSIPMQLSFDYEYVKRMILQGYELVPEAYRQKFRQVKRKPGQTCVEFARTQAQLFDKWCRSAEATTLEKLRNLVLAENFLSALPTDVSIYLSDKQVTDLHTLARMADEYELRHKPFSRVSFGGPRQGPSPPLRSQPPKAQPITSSERRPWRGPSGNPLPSDREERKSLGQETRRKYCEYCQRTGHDRSKCFALHPEIRPNALALTELSYPFANQDPCMALEATNPGEPLLPVSLACDSVSNRTPAWLKGFDPFLTTGRVSLTGAEWQPVTILRDTGASQSLLLANLLPFCQTRRTGTVVLRGITSKSISVPLHKIHLESELVTGNVEVGISLSLPVAGVSMIMGNDLAGSRVVPKIVTNPALLGVSTESEDPVVYPACAVTRSQTKAQHTHPDEEPVRLEDTFLAQLNHGGSDSEYLSPDPSLDEAETDQPLLQRSSPVVQKELSPVSPATPSSTPKCTTLEDAQGEDPSLEVCHKLAMTEEEAKKEHTGYFYRDGILMRKWKAIKDPSPNSVLFQIVLPQPYRGHVLHLAHDVSMAGHRGATKTYQRVTRFFWWPKCKKDVISYCRKCDVCQRAGKPNQAIVKAPLQPIKAVREPFSHILADCVGPLPTTKQGYKYILTIMDLTTRFPEAIPLRNITTPMIIKGLTSFFTTFGLPRVIQTDQGANFTSNSFQDFCVRMGVQHKTSSPYHPESQGAIERFHQSLKTMIRTFCEGQTEQWDKGLPFLLFAARDSVQDSLGYSPFQLVFGHEVRGPLKLYKEKLLDREPPSALLSPSDMAARLDEMKELAKEHLCSTQLKMKTRFDKASKLRIFLPGDQVLLLTSTPGQPLSYHFQGPYVVLGRVGYATYKISTPGRRKKVRISHVNRLKAYHSSDPEPLPLGTISRLGEPTAPEEAREEQSPTLQNSEVRKDLSRHLAHLEENQQAEIVELVNEYADISKDVPSRTHLITHHIQVTGPPVKQPPYRLSQAKREVLRKEVQEMLANGLIEPSRSCWSSPCVLVPKPDGTVRLCTDYRKVNQITIDDSFPMPLLEDCIDEIGSAKFITTLDLFKGYWQVPLTEEAKEISAFVTPDGFFQYTVMPFGLKNAPATFQRLINYVIQGIPNCRAYLDDIVVYDQTWDGHFQTLKTLFTHLRDANLTINLKKCVFGKGVVKFLGHEVGSGKVLPLCVKIEAIKHFPIPVSKKEVMRFLGMAGFYRRFCENFATIACPLTNLLKKNVKYKWTECCQTAFTDIKALLSSAPVLASPDHRRPFRLEVDASEVGAGAVLLQEDEDGVNHPVCYFSKKFSQQQGSYSVIEKEALALILAISKFDVYLRGQPFTVYTDHNPLIFINRMKCRNARILRWSLFLQEYTFQIKHLPGRNNVLADALSRVFPV